MALKDEEEEKELHYAAHQQQHQDKAQQKINYASLTSAQQNLYDYYMYKQRHEKYLAAEETAKNTFDNLVSDKSNTILYGGDERKMLTDYYSRWGDSATQALNNNDLEGYYKSVIMQNKIKEKLGDNSALDFLSDLNENAFNTLETAFYRITEDFPNQVWTDATTPTLDASSLYTITDDNGKTFVKAGDGYHATKGENLTTLKQIYDTHKDDEKIQKLYNDAAGSERNLSFAEYQELVDYTNNLVKTEAYEKGRSFESKAAEQRYQEQKLKEMLSWNDFGQGVLNTESTVVNMIPSILAATATGGAGAAPAVASMASIGTLGANAAAQATNEKLAEGYGFDQAYTYGLGIGAVEALTEVLGGEAVNSLLFGKVASTPLGKAIAKPIENRIKGKAGKAIAGIFSNVGAEMTEEAISAAIDPIWGKITLDEDINPGEYIEGIFKSAVEAIPSTLILMGAGYGQIVSTVNATEKSLINNITNSTSLTNEQKAEMIRKVQDVSQDAKLGIATNYDQIVGTVQSQLQSAEVKNKAVKYYASVVNQDQNMTPEQRTQAINEFANKFGQTYNADNYTTQEILDKSKQTNTKYENTKLITAEINQMLKQDPAVKSATPVTEINQVQQNIKNIIEKLTGKQVVYVNMDANGEKVYGFTNPTSGDNIYINSNLNTTNALAASYHEIGHHYKLQYPELYKAYVNTANVTGMSDYDIEEKFGNYIGQIMTKPENVKLVENKTKTLFEKLKDVGNQISNKALGTEIKNQNVSAYNLSNTSYLGEDLLNNKQLEQQVLDTFKNLGKVDRVKEATKTTEKLLKKNNTKVDKTKSATYNEGKKSSLQILYDEMKADNKSEQAIRRAIGLRIGAKPNSTAVDTELSKLKGETKFSIVGKKALDNVKNNKDFAEFVNNYYVAKNKAKNGTDNETIRQETGWFQDKNSQWKFEFSDFGLKIRPNFKLIEGEEYKLGDVIEHSLLFDFYPELKEYPVKIKNLGDGVFGGHPIAGKWIFINPNVKNESALKHALLHEIQHAIQKTEGFSKGTSLVFGTLNYLNNLGEIEAEDVAKRYELDSKGDLDFYTMPPESSKENPVHPLQKSYQEGKITPLPKLYDKIMNGLYSFVKGEDNVAKTKTSKEKNSLSMDNSVSRSDSNGRNKMGKPKGQIKFSKELDKDTTINNLRNELAKAEDQKQADEMWAKRTGRAPLIKKINTRDNKIAGMKSKQQLQKLVAKYKRTEKYQQRKMSELRTKLRETIKKFKSSEAFKYLSEEEQEQFKDSFGSYYLKANSKSELTKQKEFVKSMIAQMLDEDPNIVISDKIKEMIDAPEQKTFSEVKTLEELQTLYDGLKDTIDQAKGIQKLVGLARDVDVQKEKENFVQDVYDRFEDVAAKKAIKQQNREQLEASVGGKIVNALGSVINKIRDTAHEYFTQLSTLKTQLLYMAGGDKDSKILDLYRNLQEGVSRERTAYLGLNKSIDKFLKDKKYAELRKSLTNSNYQDTGITKRDTYGIEHKIRLDDKQKISLAFHSMQDQSKAHINGKIVDIKVNKKGQGKTYKRQGGGLTIPNESLKKAGKMADAIKEGYTVKLTNQEIDQILGKQIDEDGNVTFTKLTPEQNEFIQALRNGFFKKTAEYTNEVSNARRGYDIATIENYFPLMSNKAYIYAKNLDQSMVSSHEAEALGILDNSGFLKERSTDNAFNPIVLEDITDVITRMMNGVSKYYGYDIALYNNQVLLNSRTDEGVSTEDMLNKIDRTFTKNYGQLSNFIAGRKELPNDFMTKFRGKHAEFTLGLNPSVWVKQLLSIPTTMKYYKTSDLIGYIAGGELRLHNAMNRFLKANGISERRKVLHNFASFLTDDLEYRGLGYSNPDAEDFKRNKSLFKKLDILKGISRFDMLGVNTVTRMFLYSELNNRGLLDGEMNQISAEELDDIFSDIGARLEEFLRETQPDYSQVNRPNIVRNSGVVSRLLTMYSTATLQMYNNMSSSKAEMEYGIKSGNKKLAVQMTSRMFKSALGVAVASAGSVAISRLFDKLLKQKDDDDDFDFIKEFSVTLLAPTLILDDIARGALGLTQYESQTPELAAYDALIGIAGDINKLATEEDSKKFKTLEDMIKKIGLATGIPTRDLMNIVRTTLLMSNSDLYYQISLRENQYAYKAWLEKAEGSNAKEFYTAYQATRDANLEKNYGYVKGSKAGTDSSKKASYERALRDVLPESEVEQYMETLGGYKK